LKKFCVLIVLLTSFNVFSVNSQTEKIRVKGTVYDPENRGAIPNLMVVNKRTQQGFFGYNSGDFDLEALKTDTLIIAATGFATMQVCFRDSLPASVYTLRLALKKMQVNHAPVDIFTNRDLDEIQRDIEKLGYDKGDYMLEGVDAFESPITALYQAFSRRERNKREVAEMRNNDNRRALLKELFRKYVDNDIIQLDNNEFDEFIDFCGVSDEFLKSSTQYDFIMYIKKRFEVFRLMKNRW
jgi:hypothetical protein